VAFGTHTSEKYGYTVSEIIEDGYKDIVKIETVTDSDSAIDISRSMATTINKFSDLWNQYRDWIDIAICLGDRYEMFAAVASSVPFNIEVAHLHGGETTLGAIDNKFRHCITSMSSTHFVATEMFEEKVIEITGKGNNVHNVGALSMDKLSEIEFYDVPAFQNAFAVDLSIPTILVTIHPETTNIESIDTNTDIFICTLKKLSESYQILITLPNADTNGNKIRAKLNDLSDRNNKVICKESLGYRGYFSAMKHCKLLLGNTSSGIIEAASFEKFVINIGSRQKGRATSKNIYNAGFNEQEITTAVSQIKKRQYKYTGSNIYFKADVADKIINVLKSKNYAQA